MPTHDSQKSNGIVWGFLGGLVGALILQLVLGSVGAWPLDQRDPQGIAGDVTVSSLDVSDIVSEVNPAVVSIVITRDVPVVERYYEDPFGDFFGIPSPFQVPRERQRGTQRQEIGGGSGFLVSADGYIVTNAHVVAEEEADYTVFSNEGEKHEARVIARDPVLDIALLKINTSNQPYLQFGSSDDLNLGEPVIAIGNALGEFRNTVSTGVISGLSRNIVAGNGAGYLNHLENIIQTDAAINPGNSGGPLLNLKGEVVGVNVAVAQGSENIGFALPADAVQSSVESMKTHGKVIRPYLGVRYIPVTPVIQEQNNLPVDYGALVARGSAPGEVAVIPGSPADKAGLEEGDIILEFNGNKIDTEHSLASLTRSAQVGETVRLKVWHEGEEKTVEVTLEEAPE